MLDLMAIGIIVWNLHVALHALLYMFYREARDFWDNVTRWFRPYFWIIEDQFWILIAVGQLVL